MIDEKLFINAKNVNIKGSDKPDIKIINNLAKTIKPKNSGDIYAIDAEGVCTPYANTKEASAALSISTTTINKCLNRDDKQVVSKGNYFIRANDIGMKDEDGNTIFDKNGEPVLNPDVISKAKDEIEKKALYLIKANGEYTKIKYFHEGLGNGLMYDIDSKKLSATNNHYYIMARYIDKKDAKGNYVLDKEEYDKWLEHKRLSAIYAPDREGNYTRFNNSRIAAKILDNITLDPKTKRALSSDGYKIFRAIEIESKDENGLYYLDKEKLSALLDAA